MIDLCGRETHINITDNLLSYASAFDRFKPDPDWLYVDRAGHSHIWVGNDVPTLRTIVDEVIPHCQDEEYWEEEISHQECRICGEPITPHQLIDIPAGEIGFISRGKSISGEYELFPDEDFPDGKHEFSTPGMNFFAQITKKFTTDGKRKVTFEGRLDRTELP